jgi:ketosteroid isomerase-like protein
MSQESTTPDPVERWQKAAEAYARRDLDTAMRHFAPDAVWDFSSAGFGSFEGVAAIRSFLEDWLDAYEEYEYKQEEGQDLGNGVLFVVATLGGRPAGGAGGVQERWSYTVTWADGMVERVVVSQDIEKARAAAERLAESRAQADV